MMDKGEVVCGLPSAVALMATALACSCSANTTGPDDAGYVRIEREWVSGIAAAAVGLDGRFNFDAPLLPRAGELSREASLTLAQAAVRHIGMSVGGGREYIEVEEHGAPIDWERLAPCGRRTIPIATVLDDPGQTVPRYIRTALGPEYRFEFCDSAHRPTIAVRIYVRTEAQVGQDGRIEFPVPLGDEFVVSGIPIRPLADLTPEYSARLVFSRLGVPIEAVPELDGCVIVIPLCTGMQGRHWKHVVARPVRVRRASGVVEALTEFFTQAGFGDLQPDEVYIAAGSQPPPTWHAFTVIEPGNVDRQDSVLLRVVRPLRLERFQLMP
jgi:hypothetical protein